MCYSPSLRHSMIRIRMDLTGQSSSGNGMMKRIRSHSQILLFILACAYTESNFYIQIHNDENYEHKFPHSTEVVNVCGILSSKRSTATDDFVKSWVTQSNIYRIMNLHWLGIIEGIHSRCDLWIAGISSSNVNVTTFNQESILFGSCKGIRQPIRIGENWERELSC